VSEKRDEFLTEWHRAVHAKDAAALGAMLAPDVSFGVPPYWDKIQGRELSQHLLGIIIRTIEDFTYHREWREGDEYALEFRGHVGEHELQGIDLITLNGDAVVQNLDVLMRPLNSILALREIVAPQMAAFLASRSGNTA